MKKVMLSAAALLIGGFAFAQITPGTPDQAVRITNHSSNSDANTGEAVQDGNDQRVYVNQVGRKQSAAVYQSNGTEGTGGNRAWINQVEDAMFYSGYKNAAVVNQMGTDNHSMVMQSGKNNSVITTQGNSDSDHSSGNRMIIQQTHIGHPVESLIANNKVEAAQFGKDNQLRVRQDHKNNNLLTSSNGKANKIDVLQRSTGYYSEGHAAEIDQLGDRNEAFLRQEGMGAGNDALVWQRGKRNVSVQQQTATETSGSGNNAFVNQGAMAPVSDLGIATVGKLEAVDNSIFSGSDNFVSHDAIAIQNQEGEGNIVETNQNGKGNHSLQKQQGVENVGVVFQNATGTVYGYNTVHQQQTGNFNDAAIAQKGSDHQAWQRQIGNKNKMVSTQRGTENLTSAYQKGNNNVAYTAQAGHHNKIAISQYDGQSFSVKQNLGFGGGADNQASILQQGPGGTNANIYQCDVTRLSGPDYVPVPTVNIPDLCPGC